MKCKIRWIDRYAKTTEDDNDAVAIAVAVFELPHSNGMAGEEKSYPICQNHLDYALRNRLDVKTYGNLDSPRYTWFSYWRFDPLPKS